MRRVAENTPSGVNIGDPVAARDDDNDPLTYTLGGTDAASFGIVASTGQLRTAGALDRERKSTYTVSVGVRDSRDAGGDPDMATDTTITITISVTDVNEPPLIAGSASVNYAENDTGIVATYTAADPEGATVVWETLGGADSDDFSFSNGVLRFVAPPDYEAPADNGGNNAYQIRLRTSDGPNTVTHAVTVTVSNEEETGALSLSSEQPQVGTELTATLTDLDGPTSNESWTWERSPNRSSWTVISGAATRFYTPADADLNHYLRVTVEYTDGHGSGKRLQEASDYRVQAAPGANEPPEFTALRSDREIAENSPAQTPVGAPVTANDPDNDTLTYTLDDNGGDLFTIDGNGQIRVKQGTVLDHEDPNSNSYSVTVTATDPSTASDSIPVDITVTDVNEPPEAVRDDATTVEDMSVEIEVLLNDSDPEGESLSVLSVASPVNGVATVEADHTITYIPRADFHGVDTFTYRASDGALSADATVVVTISSLNDSPQFAAAMTKRTVAAGAAADTEVGAPVEATDRDGDTLTYLLGGVDASSFEIDEYTAQITVASGTVLDPSSQDSYTVTVTATDTSGASGDITVTITVTMSVRSGVGGGGGGGGGGGRSRATPTPTPTPSPTPTPTPSPTPTPIPSPTGPQFSGVIAAEPSVTATVVPEGTTLGLNGGGDEPGGIYVNFPPTAVALPVHVSVSVSNAAPDDVTAPSGTTLLPLTIDISPETPLTLGEPLTIEINPTPEQLAAAGGDLNNLAVGVVTPNGVVVLPTQVLHGRLVVTIDHLSTFVLVAITDPGPVLTQPPPGDASSMGPLLQWTQPPGTTWFQVQVIPFNEDGPGINLVIGDGAQVRAAQYQVMAPNFGSADPNYVLLPDMTYLWRVRTSTVLTNPTEADWSAWAASSFKTPPASSSTISRVAPPFYGEVRTLTPTLTWANSDPAVFYYEVQLSKDFEFGPNAILYSEYVHGGASTPLNSYVVPEAFPLEAGAFYYWRVRPRIQGDGDPLPWSSTYVFQAPPG